MVLEVNSSPGLEGIEKASGVDVADKIIEYLENEHTNRDKSKPIDIKKNKFFITLSLEKSLLL